MPTTRAERRLVPPVQQSSSRAERFVWFSYLGRIQLPTTDRGHGRRRRDRDRVSLREHSSRLTPPYPRGSNPQPEPGLATAYDGVLRLLRRPKSVAHCK